MSNVVVTATGASTATVSFAPGAGNTGFVVTYHLANDTTRRVNTTTSPATIMGLVPGQTYYVQVVSQCGAGASAVYTNSSSLAFSFRGANTLSAQNTLGAGAFSAYPSSAHEVLSLSLPALPGTSLAQVALLNTLGQPVKTSQLKLRSSGTEAQLDLGGVRPGLYMLRVVAGEPSASWWSKQEGSGKKPRWLKASGAFCLNTSRRHWLVLRSKETGGGCSSHSLRTWRRLSGNYA